MIFFGSSKSFLSVVLSQNLCEFYYLKINSNKQIVSEKFDKFSLNSDENFKEILSNFTDLKEKNLNTAILVNDDNETPIIGENSEKMEHFFYQEIDKNFTSKFKRESYAQIENDLGLNFHAHTGIFKTLYFLYKNQKTMLTSMFVLKFDNKVAVLFADRYNVFYANLVKCSDNRFALENGEADEAFYDLLKDEIANFYKSQNSDFIDNIYIYNDGSLSNEIGYVIFTRIFVKTSIVPVELAKYIAKIALKESM